MSNPNPHAKQGAAPGHAYAQPGTYAQPPAQYGQPAYAPPQQVGYQQQQQQYPQPLYQQQQQQYAGPPVVVHHNGAAASSAPVAYVPAAPVAYVYADDGCCNCRSGACCAFPAHLPLAARRQTAYAVIIVALGVLVALGATLSSTKFVSVSEFDGPSAYFGPMRYQDFDGSTHSVSGLISAWRSGDSGYPDRSDAANDLAAAHGSAVSAVVFAGLAALGAVAYLLVPASSPSAMTPVWMAAMGVPAFASFLCAVIMESCLMSLGSDLYENTSNVDDWETEWAFFIWVTASIFVLLSTSFRSCYARCCSTRPYGGAPARPAAGYAAM